MQDDFWRRNHATVGALRIHAPDFNPWYSLSIAYRPLPRPALDAFLAQRGLLKPSSNSIFALRGTFHSGFVIHIYFRINEIVYENQPSKVRISAGHHDLVLNRALDYSYGRRNIPRCVGGYAAAITRNYKSCKNVFHGHRWWNRSRRRFDQTPSFLSI